MNIQDSKFTPTYKLHRFELNNVVKKIGVEQKKHDGIDGVKQHWKDEVHEEDGTPLRNNTKNDPDYVKELKKAINMLNNSGGVWTAWDDVTNAELDPKQVHEARLTEMKLFKEMNAHNICSMKCVEEENGKLIDIKWIDVNQGDAANLVYRSRLVGKECQRVQG